MVRKFCNLSWKVLIAGTVAILVRGFIIVNSVSYAYESACRGKGFIEETVYTAEDFEIIGLEKRDNVWAAVSDDPQMILNGERMITSIKFYMDYSVMPGEVVMYYTKSPDSPFSSKMRVWAVPVQGEDGWYEFNMRPTKVYSVRIDPTMVAGNKLEFTEFRFNESQSLSSYFKLTYTHFYYLIVITMIVSSCLKLVQELFTICLKKYKTISE